LHPRDARAPPSGLLQPFQVRPAPFGEKLHGSVIAIADPTSKAQTPSLSHQEVPEPDSLHVAMHHSVQTLHLREVTGFILAPFGERSVSPILLAACAKGRGARLKLATSVAASSILAIGDELVGGFTLDTNSHWLAERLRLLGFPVKRITAIRDRPQEIVDQVHRELGDDEVKLVFCTGGLGPTPDDRTFSALAEALGRELTVWEETRARIERRVQRMHEAGLLDSPELTEGNLRMARIPAGPAHVFKNRRGMAPGVVYEANGKRIFVLPGVPLEMKGIFTEELEPQFLSEGSAATVRELRFTFAVEARFYPLMKELEQSFPDISVGSYPNFETKELVIRCLGADPKRVEEVIELVRRRSTKLGMAATG
jgi:nicotinamide-nucleotide amidase